MSDEIETKPGTAFWVVGVLFLLWNLFGCAMYLFDATASDEALRAMENGEAWIAAKAVYPMWAQAAYAIAVWGGLLAAILLLLKKKLAVPLFVVSLIAAIICFIPNFTMAEMKAMDPDTYWLMPIIVVLLGLFEIWWSKKQRARGILS